MKAILLNTAVAILLVLTLANCAQNPVTGRTNFVTMSESQEVQTGREEEVKGGQENGPSAVLERRRAAAGEKQPPPQPAIQLCRRRLARDQRVRAARRLRLH